MAIVPMYSEDEEDDISDQQIQNMVVMFQMEDAQAVGAQVIHQLHENLQIFFELKAAHWPESQLDIVRGVIEQGIVDMIYYTHNIIVDRDEAEQAAWELYFLPYLTH